MTEPLPIVLVPGLLCTARIWERVAPRLTAHGPVTVADTARDDSVAAMARRLLADAPARFALAGVSMGGYVALEVMRQAPERIAALGLVSTSARPDSPEQTAARLEQVEAARRGDLVELARLSFPFLVDESRSGDDGLRELSADMAGAVGAEVFERQIAACIGRPDSRPTLATLTCPVAVVHGAADRLIPLENGEEIAAGIAHAQFAILEHCGHMSPAEQPAAVAEALGALLDSLPERARR